MRYCLIMESSWFLAAIKAEVILGLAQAEAGGRANQDQREDHDLHSAQTGGFLCASFPLYWSVSMFQCECEVGYVCIDKIC